MIRRFAAYLFAFFGLGTLSIAAVAQQATPAMSYEAMRAKVNAGTVGLAAGLIEGAPLRLAAEMSRVVEDGPNLLVLPIVTRGPTENVNDLLYLKGIDLAIINSDVLDEYKADFPNIRMHIAYLLTSCRRNSTSSFDPKSRACRTSPASRQEGEFQHARYGSGLFRPADVQSARHQRRQDLHPPPRGAAADEVW